MKSSLVPHKMCLDKVAYNSKKEAARELEFWSCDERGSRISGPYIDSRLKVYKCAFCSKYHLGKSTRR